MPYKSVFTWKLKGIIQDLIFAKDGVREVGRSEGEEGRRNIFVLTANYLHVIGNTDSRGAGDEKRK